jgi:CheY-like chemotaxis protein
MMDEELLAAFREEFLPLCAALAVAGDLAAAQRLLAQMRGMADGMQISPLQLRLAALTQEEALPVLHDAAKGLAALAEGRAAVAEGHGAEAILAATPEPVPAPPLVRTLIVDDSAMMRRLLRGILSGDPRFTVVGEATDGAAGLSAHAELRPELTLLDLEMPVLDGFGFLAEWAVSGHGRVVVVSSAAHPGSPAALEVLRRGAFAAVAKPSGALSPDLAERSGVEILATLRDAAGLAS